MKAEDENTLLLFLSTAMSHQHLGVSLSKTLVKASVPHVFPIQDVLTRQNRLCQNCIKHLPHNQQKFPGLFMTQTSQPCAPKVPAAALLEAPSDVDATGVLVCVAALKISHEQSSAG